MNSTHNFVLTNMADGHRTFELSRFYRAHVDGAMVARPLFTNFPQDSEAYHVDQQFMWGPSLLITPVLEEGATEVKGYFPEGVWFSFLNENEEPLVSKGEWIVLPTPTNSTNVRRFRKLFI